MNNHADVLMPDKKDALRHVELITGLQSTEIYLRFVDTAKRVMPSIEREGTIEQLWPEVVKRQLQKYCVFVIVNAGKAAGGFVEDNDIKTIRCVFIDGDDIPMPEKWHVRPDFIVRRDDIHWHAYWLVDGLPVTEFKHIQRRLAANYGTDPKVCNPSRIMRLAGTLHLKNPETPYLVTLSDRSGDRERWEIAHMADELRAGLPEVVTKTAASKAARPDFVANQPQDVARAIAFLKGATPAIEFQGSDAATIEIANEVGDLGISEDITLELIEDCWVPRCEGEWTHDWLAAKVASAYRSRQNEIGCHAVGDTPAAWIEYAAQNPTGANEIDEVQRKQVDDEAAAERRAKYRGVKPSEGAKRPVPVFWDKDKTLPRSPAGSRIFAFGKYSSHKTNLVLSKCIDAIIEHDARVLYVSPEDSDELFERIKAQCALRGITIESLDDKLVVVESCPPITDAGEVDALLAEHEAFAPNIVVVDTWSEAMTGLDENSAKDASAAMHQVGRIRKKWSCEVILVHHLGKAETKGARGSSVFLAGANAAWKISYEKERGVVTQYVEKLKRGEAKFSVYYGVKVFDDVMTVTRPDAVAAAAMRKTAEAPARDTNSALKQQVLAAMYAATKRDVMVLESRQVAEHINRNAPVADRDRLVENDMKKIQRAVDGTGKKPGILSDLVKLDTRGDPVKPFRFVLPDRYREEMEELEEVADD